MQASSSDISSSSDVPGLSTLSNAQSNTSGTVIAVADSLPQRRDSAEGAIVTPLNRNASDIADPGDESDACIGSEHRELTNNIENENDNCSLDSDDGDNASEISDFSNFSQESWQPVQGPIAWVQEQMRQGHSPRKILGDLVPAGTVIPEGLDPIMLWKIIINIVSEPPKRKKLHDINTLSDVLHLLKTCKNIIVLTGAGVSVSCGIPDFRSRDGVYARLTKDFPNLPDPQAMFDIHFFRSDPRPFFKFAREIYPGQFQPSLCHKFIRLLERKGQLLRNYTQNIDTLEQVAGVQSVVQCHGSFATATCAVCGHKVDSDAIKEDIVNQVIPRCPRCSPSSQNAVMKPDIVFFGESLPEHFHNQMAADKDECDLLIVIGSSLKVRPVALIPNSLPAHVPQILINRERLRYLNFDVELLGNCDDIVGELCRRLGPGWEELAAPGLLLNEVSLSNLPTPSVSPYPGESRDRWDDSSNAAVSSSEATVVCSDNTPAFSVVSKKQRDDNTTPIVETWEQFGNEKDSGISEVSTSQSESVLIKQHKVHYHRHTVKRPFSSLNSSAVALQVSADQLTSDFSQSDQRINNSCSSTDVETLVSAGHKKDVMYIPSEKICGHHGQPCHHFHDSVRPHHDHSVARDKAKSSVSITHSPPAVPEQTPSHHNDHNCHHKNSSAQDQLRTCRALLVEVDKLSASEQPQSHSERADPYSTLSSCHPVEADSREEHDRESCSSSKRRRLSFSHEQENADVHKRDNSDSLSHEESLDDIRRMWRSKRRISLAQRLTDDQVLYLPPSRYVFKGAEVFSDSESEDSDEDDENEEENDSIISSNISAEPENGLDLSDHSNTGVIIVDSTLPLSCGEGNTPACPLPVTLSPKGHKAGIDSSTTGVLVENTPNDETGNTSHLHDSSQHIECTFLPNIPKAQSSTKDTLYSCPVPSTEDLSTQEDNALHSIQE